MRLLFLSGTTVGGSGRSQRELAARLRGRGHQVLVVADLETGHRLQRVAYEQLADLAVRWGERPGAGLVRRLESLPGRRATAAVLDGVDHLLTPVPENGVAPVLASFRPDVVIGSSLVRLTWQKARSAASRHGVPTVLYVRETEALNHFERGRRPADAVVANAESLALRIRELGVDCPVFPSVIETSVTEVRSSREVALVINPIESRGVDLVWDIAARLPEVRFVLQESWPLSREQLALITTKVRSAPNVELRRAEPPGPRLYRDVRLLLVPYRIDNRPRVIAEAQANGIPVIAGDVPALVEATGDGGVLVPLDDVLAWVEAIRSLWADHARYSALAEAATAHSRRSDADAGVIVEGFEAFLRDVVGHPPPSADGA